ncbi:hypothetical protein [Mariniblastus fucicola]|uniref:Lipoprotein n=1 Tax=Mariniblastus fucicola TaxID=980251 RepID=A0A5B9PK01_9BACT|nr:hypothetical protein [Mariniblastus fucicola]QEG22981.1 hypothetical protein MFFC18_28730 [Mariniblastus fucicola]
MLFKTKFKSSVLLGLLSVGVMVGCDSATDTDVKKVDEATVSSTETSEPDAETSTPKDDGADSETNSNESAEPEDAAPETAASDATNAEPTEDAAEGEAGFDVSVAEGGALTFKAPASWKKVKPRSFVVEYEIAVPKSEGEAEDAADGRLTIMGAGGSVQANIDRWYGQYTQPDGGETKDASKVTETMIGETKVTWVDITGTLMDTPGGPMAGGKVVERENYRTLAAIVQAGEHGQYFIKLYGPGKTISDNEAAFKAFVESLEINDEARGL